MAYSVGDIVTVHIVGIAPNGDGYGYIDGKLVFVKGGRFNRVHRAKIIKVTPDYYVAEVV